ncbi:MAG: NUDIX domain-containing protein [Asgard group archaeon]|nr:NUDIX domain-containing protein [Asgard group archaeon]
MSFPKVMVAVAAIIENPDGNILLIKRSSESEEYPDYWEDVGGRLKQSETPDDGLKREIREETSISDIEIIKPLTMFHVFRKGIKKSENELIGISYWCKTNCSEVTLSHEHSEYKWVSPTDAFELTEHPALKSYIQIYLDEKNLSEKVQFIYDWKERFKS